MNCALLLAGGCGTRFGQEVPKQFALVKGKPVISYTLDVFQNHPMIDMMREGMGRGALAMREGLKDHKAA